MKSTERILAIVFLIATSVLIFTGVYGVRLAIETRQAREFYHQSHETEQQLLKKIEIEQQQELTNMDAGRRSREQLNAKVDMLLADRGLKTPPTTQP